jgi:hypothetical protein
VIEVILPRFLFRHRVVVKLLSARFFYRFPFFDTIFFLEKGRTSVQYLDAESMPFAQRRPVRSIFPFALLHVRVWGTLDRIGFSELGASAAYSLKQKHRDGARRVKSLRSLRVLILMGSGFFLVRSQGHETKTVSPRQVFHSW